MRPTPLQLLLMKENARNLTLSIRKIGSNAYVAVYLQRSFGSFCLVNMELKPDGLTTMRHSSDFPRVAAVLQHLKEDALANRVLL